MDFMVFIIALINPILYINMNNKLPNATYPAYPRYSINFSFHVRSRWWCIIRSDILFSSSKVLPTFWILSELIFTVSNSFGRSVSFIVIFGNSIFMLIISTKVLFFIRLLGFRVADGDIPLQSGAKVKVFWYFLMSWFVVWTYYVEGLAFRYYSYPFISVY